MHQVMECVSNSQTGVLMVTSHDGTVLKVPEEAELMQFTGLLGKNGKEIYEGDIVEWDDDSKGKWRRRCEVVYTPAHYRLIGYYYNFSKPEIHQPIEFDCGAFAYEKETEKELEVIGNIYENPELMRIRY